MRIRELYFCIYVYRKYRNWTEVKHADTYSSIINKLQESVGLVT